MHRPGQPRMLEAEEEVLKPEESIPRKKLKKNKKTKKKTCIKMIIVWNITKQGESFKIKFLWRRDRYGKGRLG